ncbi:Cef1p [Sugiyamaella lignohabitans]|uniref:Pre-mRNA-splicing factor CEF1 n=1 Tax=Sugiyamaella lignohabitans TaxID=796027 RepID=A0A161HNT1_9ASCO|nr:Cef1p [Sugiyamaella lignohabitans]ANB15857.1 Cef1p [Sugiyamaella lignohabitans]
MAPTYVKGGVWTNVEDEILRAAISKYGLNQWARVSSLLVRKTAKQAKARWSEWLDPSVKKIEWSQEEDEKLLHLAKIMPTQWRSIAPIVGRTATQCIERYQKLLDDAERGESSSDLNLTGVDVAGPSVDSVRKFRPGDIDPTPESKPARPDEVDMDEDEKEMLAEARARLANTQGKKAKRKDRERLLNESKRLAFLQKRRQLKQAGIVTKINTRPKNKSTAFSIDYNADVPFEHKPAIGFYDTSEEKAENERQKEQYDRLIASKGVPQSGRDDKEKKERNDKKRERNEASEAQAAAARAEKLHQLSQADQVAKRRKLMLPQPQVGVNELEQIIKHTRRGDEMKNYNDTEDGDSGLIGDYSAAENTALPLRTPSVASGESSVQLASKELINLTKQQSSLLGEVNVPLNGQSKPIETALPPSKTYQTPNVLLSQTPRRDFFGVNDIGVEATPRDVIRRKFLSLPKPKNDFEIVLPKQDDLAIEDEAPEIAEDANERDKRIAAEREAEYQRQLNRRSKSIQKDLPRPAVIPQTLSPSGPTEYGANLKIILDEAVQLLRSDNTKYPSENRVISGPILEDIDDDLKDSIEALFLKEAEKSGSKSFVNVAEDPCELDLGKSTVTDSLSKLAEKLNKQEQKLAIVLGGYIKRQSLLKVKCTEAQEALISAAVESATFATLRDMEAIGASNRIATLQEEVNFLTDAERAAQAKYRYLVDVRNELLL